MSRERWQHTGGHPITETTCDDPRCWCNSGGVSELLVIITALRKVLAQYAWRPIDKIHEDYGPCVLMNINDPGYQEIGSNLNTDFDESKWTHFAEVPKLTNEQAEELMRAMPRR